MVLETDRLYLREIKDSDLENLSTLMEIYFIISIK